MRFSFKFLRLRLPAAGGWCDRDLTKRRGLRRLIALIDQRHVS
jgi:hypothetical protein